MIYTRKITYILICWACVIMIYYREPTYKWLCSGCVNLIYTYLDTCWRYGFCATCWHCVYVVYKREPKLWGFPRSGVQRQLDARDQLLWNYLIRSRPHTHPWLSVNTLFSTRWSTTYWVPLDAPGHHSSPPPTTPVCTLLYPRIVKVTPG